MSSALPEPKPRFTTSLRAVMPGEPAQPSGPALPPTPIEPESGMSFVLVWNIFRLTVWAAIAVWVYPHLLNYVGGEHVARWLLSHSWVRMLGMPPLGLLALISVFEPINGGSRRAAREDLARGTGAALVDVRGLDVTYGLSSGPGVRVPLGARSMVVGSWTRDGNTHTVASVEVDTRSAFSFIARGPDREPAMLRGLQQFALGLATRKLAEQARDPRAAAAAATLAYLAKSPIATGNDAIDRAVVLRSNQPDAARALFTSSTVASAVTALDVKTRNWDWTFYPAASPDKAEMRLECPGALNDAESLRIAQTLMRAALEEMTRAGVVKG